MNIQKYWEVTLQQDAKKMKDFFWNNAKIYWYNTNECFDVDEYIQVNCQYPDFWNGDIERIETIENLIITVTHVYATNKPLSFHVVSFIQIKEDKIIRLDEYWGDDGEIPQWRKDLKLGHFIKHLD